MQWVLCHAGLTKLKQDLACSEIGRVLLTDFVLLFCFFSCLSHSVHLVLCVYLSSNLLAQLSRCVARCCWNGLSPVLKKQCIGWEGHTRLLSRPGREGWVPAAKLESNLCWERLSKQLNSWSRETLNCKQKMHPSVWYCCPVKWSFRHRPSRWGLCLLELLQAHFEGVDLLSVFLMMSYLLRIVESFRRNLSFFLTSGLWK